MNKITICVGIKNRTKALMDCLIQSMNNCIDNDMLSLSIFDCGSTDIIDLENVIKQNWKGNLYFSKEDRKFSRSYAFNRAIEQCRTNYVFICDADISIPIDFVRKFRENVDICKTWFPICFSLLRGKEKIIDEDNNGWWREKGFGMVGIHKSTFNNSGNLNENFIKWGGEDNDLYNRVNGIKIRENCIGLFHNWHPSPYNMRVTPERFRNIEYKKKLVLAITTYNRIEYLKRCIDSWNNTRDKRHEWTLIIADDGSTDGTIEYLKYLNIDNIKKHLILNNRMGVHYQTNQILKYCSNIDFEYGFKTDDDIIYIKKDWDNKYIEAIENTKYDHLCFFDYKWGKRRGTINAPIKSNDGFLQSYIKNKDVQGAFWTFTHKVIDKVGYFDIDEFGFCGLGHVDYTYRCARAGFNDLNNIYDYINSNEYIKLFNEFYVSAITNNERYFFNSNEVLLKKRRTIEENRIYIAYKENKDLIEELKELREKEFKIVNIQRIVKEDPIIIKEPIKVRLERKKEKIEKKEYKILYTLDNNNLRTIGYWLRNLNSNDKIMLNKAIKKYEWGMGKKITIKELESFLSKI
jgi:glycosyltransferase involved in cell wall biosynthesis